MASPEARKKVSEALKGRVFSEEHRAKISRAKTWQARSWRSRVKQSATMKGRKLAPETIEKIRISNTGKKRTPEQIARMREVSLGKSLSDETKAKISARWRDHGHPRGMLGKAHSPEYKQMMSRFNAAKRDYSKRFSVPCRSVTKAMLEAAGMGVG